MGTMLSLRRAGHEGALPNDRRAPMIAAWGSSSYAGRVFGSTYHAAREPQKTFCPGRIFGSSSSEPAGTTTALPLWASQGKADPQRLQKAVAKCFASGSA